MSSHADSSQFKRFTMTAVVVVPTDEEHDEDAMREELRSALTAAGYHVKLVLSNEVKIDEFL